MPRTQESMEQKEFQCYYENCNARFYRADRLESHVLVHEGERPFVCSFAECSKSYTRRSHLKRHEDNHEKSFQCTVEGCEIVLNSKATLKKHVNGMHSGKNRKTYECTVCNDSFNKHNWLRQHMYRHTGVKPYSCTVENCDKQFLVPSKLKRHLTVHEGYHCSKPECKQSFPTWSLYIKHFKVFHPVAHKCDVCDKVFSTSSNLKNHILLHSNEREVFICPKPYCTRFYFAERNLNQHIKSYHRKRPFVCPNEHCEKSFKTEKVLSSHLRVHDPTKPDRKRKKKRPEPTFAEYLAGCEPGEKGQSTTSESEMKNEILHKNSENNNSSTNEMNNEKVLQKGLKEYNLQNSNVLVSNQDHTLSDKKINEYLLDDELLNRSEILSSEDLSGNESDKMVIVFNYEPAPKTISSKRSRSIK